MLLPVAAGHHQAGRYPEAERLYREILQSEPRNGDALRLLGGLYVQSNRPAEGEIELKKAIEAQPANAEIYNNLGLALRNQKKYPEAVEALQQAVRLKPDYAEALNNLGNVFHLQQKLGEASAYYWQALRARPGYPTALHNSANVLRDMGRLNDAVARYKEGIANRPDDFALLTDYGITLYKQDRLEEAAAAYREALRAKPDYVPALANLGTALRENRKPEEAVPYYEKALQLKPDAPEIWLNLGATWWDLSQLDKAIVCYQKALAANPDYPDAHINLGTVLVALDKKDQAEGAYREALRLKPGHPDALTNLGAIAQEKVRYDEALAFYDQALRSVPDFAPARWRKGMIYLAYGRYAEGWALYEEGYGKRALRGHALFRERKWSGAAMPGGKLLIWGEQGLGDALQFVRYAALCKEKVAKVSVMAPKPLLRLFKNCPFIDGVSDSFPTDAFDAQASMMSLPFLLGTTLENIPAAMPYLFTDEATRAKWAPKFAGLKGFKVGLVWAGSAREGMVNAHLTDKKRSVTLEQLRPLFDVPGVTFVNLQMGKPAEQIGASDLGARLVNMMSEVRDFLDTAAIIENLDLVITVDTSVAHLAGGLGKPVWILSRYDACWRWLQNRAHSPWYPTARIFGQPEMGNWDAVVKQVAAALSERARV